MKYPDLHASYFFCAVAYHKGIAPAARALGIDERRNGEEIIQLEKFAGQKLIRRNTRYIGLTALGRTYFENMAPLVAHLENRTKLLALGQLERPFMGAAPADVSWIWVMIRASLLVLVRLRTTSVRSAHAKGISVRRRDASWTCAR